MSQSVSSPDAREAESEQGAPSSIVSRDAAVRLWDAALGRLQLQVPRPTFDTWLAGTTGGALLDDRLVIEVPTEFGAEWIEGRIHTLVEEAVGVIVGRRVSVAYCVGLYDGATKPSPVQPPPTERLPEWRQILSKEEGYEDGEPPPGLLDVNPQVLARAAWAFSAKRRPGVSLWKGFASFVARQIEWDAPGRKRGAMR